MRMQSFGRFGRELALVAAAGAIGWWAHGANSVVRASTAANGDDNLAFQFGGMGKENTLTIYSRANHTLYVYPNTVGSSRTNCEFSLKVDRPGGPIERTNCPMGSAF
jgi:hypothetical protein